LGDTPIAVLTPKTGGVDIFYVHTDHLNTPRKITRPSDNKLRWTYNPDPFGNGVPNQNPQSLGNFTYNLRFPGQYADSETGLRYNYFRDYDSATGRYVESDPIGLAGGRNTYAYAGDSPTLHADPSGLAYFAYRPIAGVGFMVLCRFFGTCQFAHEQLFFEDGQFQTNLGFFKVSSGVGEVRPDPNVAGYVRQDGGYNDCVMREAVKRVMPMGYDLLCSNCQDWAAAVRVQYAIAAEDPEVKQKCGCSNQRTQTAPDPWKVPTFDPNATGAGATTLLELLIGVVILL
jgi:RHS repeat-associated protein